MEVVHSCYHWRLRMDWQRSRGLTSAYINSVPVVVPEPLFFTSGALSNGLDQYFQFGSISARGFNCGSNHRHISRPLSQEMSLCWAPFLSFLNRISCSHTVLFFFFKWTCLSKSTFYFLLYSHSGIQWVCNIYCSFRNLTYLLEFLIFVAFVNANLCDLQFLFIDYSVQTGGELQPS